MTDVSVALHKHGVSIQSSINLVDTLPNNAGMKNRTDLNLGEDLCLSIIYHIPDS